MPRLDSSHTHSWCVIYTPCPSPRPSPSYLIPLVQSMMPRHITLHQKQLATLGPRTLEQLLPRVAVHVGLEGRGPLELFLAHGAPVAGGGLGGHIMDGGGVFARSSAGVGRGGQAQLGRGVGRVGRVGRGVGRVGRGVGRVGRGQAGGQGQDRQRGQAEGRVGEVGRELVRGLGRGRARLGRGLVRRGLALVVVAVVPVKWGIGGGARGGARGGLCGGTMGR